MAVRKGLLTGTASPPSVSPSSTTASDAKFSSCPMQAISSRNTPLLTNRRLSPQTLSNRSTSRDHPPHRGSINKLFLATANYHVVGRKNRRCSWAPRYSVIIGLVANQTDSFTATISNRCSIRQIVASSRRNTHYHV